MIQLNDNISGIKEAILSSGKKKAWPLKSSQASSRDGFAIIIIAEAVELIALSD
jgi:hypothetical protein